MTDADISVACADEDGGWSCLVDVRDEESSTRHAVSVSRAELARYAANETTPDRLVTASFLFLLEREPKESILRSFRLSDIERYFPEFGRTISSYPT